MRRLIRALAILLLLPAASMAADMNELGEHGFFDSDGVKIHYVTRGEGPLVVLLHGFPDFWYSWRAQMPVLAEHHKVVALDLRGYNESDKPEGVEAYAIPKLVGDVAAALDHFGVERATIIGHDWGGAVAWAFAMMHPGKTERLAILNSPHPKGLLRELANNPQQRANSEYARALQRPETAKALKPEMLAGWVKEPEARAKYVEALGRSSMEGMLNYYKANYPKEPYDDKLEFPKVTCPVLVIHGLNDPYLLPGALDGTWNWIDNELTLVTIPGADHFVHRDQPERVTRTIVEWLATQPKGK